MDYSVSILGDTHFDVSPIGFYHATWVPRDEADRRDRAAEFARNAEMWSGRMPRLVSAAAQTARSAGSVALFHVGDLVQGDYVRRTPPPVGEDYDGRKQTRTKEQLLDLVGEYRPGLVEYRMWRAAGHFVLRVSSERVAIDFFPGDALQPLQTFTLR